MLAPGVPVGVVARPPAVAPVAAPAPAGAVVPGEAAPGPAPVAPAEGGAVVVGAGAATAGRVRVIVLAPEEPASFTTAAARTATMIDDFPRARDLIAGTSRRSRNGAETRGDGAETRLADPTQSASPVHLPKKRN